MFTEKNPCNKDKSVEKLERGKITKKDLENQNKDNFKSKLNSKLKLMIQSKLHNLANHSEGAHHADTSSSG